MPTVEQHYDQVLSDVYSWMQGGFDAALARNAELFAKRGIAPAGSRVAIDLGAGCGFQSIPLAKLGFAVTAIDLDGKLLEELRGHAPGLDIAIVRDDLMAFETHARGNAELVVCMVDTLLHLDSKEAVRTLFAKVHAALEPGGRFIATFRDLSREALELDRFIPVRSDDNTIFTCFLEYEPDTVKVHDLVYRRSGDAWTFHKSFYRKLRLPQQWITEQLAYAGFGTIDASVERGLVTVIATR
ncbi:MAG TPA: class I SAM-dependent methyltransferase [Gammaproteobacteria bacterium]|nr:class I SAM-dependent methyltransferase [Gammaproteobacteria bacterium]